VPKFLVRSTTVFPFSLLKVFPIEQY
jgi:hypothetical protein